ncbi:MAG: VanZ family protein [Oscillospiraceae bacterium]|jgi:glycopeptide antibiotics resistance protein|nr:VanZ family protein [Oscillospiraceae bacterium]
MSKRQKRVTVGLSAVYFVLLAWLVLFKFRLNLGDLNHVRSVNLIPYGASIPGRLYLFEIVYNVLAFIPTGLYLHMLKPDWSFARKALPCFGLSLLFEVAQFVFAIGASDITDVIGNTLGGVIGIGVFALLRRALGDRAFAVASAIAAVGTAVACVFVVAVLRH